MYYHYFGLKEAPFSIAVDPRYLFMSARHRDALAHLLYGVGVGGGFILLTGEVGTGKTTVSRCLLEQLPDNTDIALILNPALNAIELLATVCDELGISYISDELDIGHEAGGQSLKVLTDKLHQFLLSNHANDRNTVLLIDEAQHLTFEVLEQIRLLTNLETNTKKLLQIIFLGQPELRTLLNKPELRQLAQRITARYQLKPLNLQETHAYIRHRLHIAGLSVTQQLFPNNVVKGIYKISGGVPRIINVLCDRMLLGTYGQNKTMVDKAMLKQATREVMGDEEDIQLHQASYTLPIAAAVIVIVGLLWWQWSTFNEPIKSPMMTSDNTALVKIVAPPAQAMVSPTPIPAPVAPLWFDNQLQATDQLMQVNGWLERSNPCFDTSDTALRCERLTVKSWQDLKAYNRPAVLTLVTRAKMLAYTVIVSIQNNQAVLNHNGEITTMPLHQLGELWTGDLIFLWQPAEFYTGPLARNDSGPMVQWLAEQFAELDGQQHWLAEQTFNAALVQRVKIFQQNNQLQADGVVGLKTLLKLHEQLGLVATLDKEPLNETPQLSAETDVNREES